MEQNDMICCCYYIDAFFFSSFFWLVNRIKIVWEKKNQTKPQPNQIQRVIFGWLLFWNKLKCQWYFVSTMSMIWFGFSWSNINGFYWIPFGRQIMHLLRNYLDSAWNANDIFTLGRGIEKSQWRSTHSVNGAKEMIQFNRNQNNRNFSIYE